MNFSQKDRLRIIGIPDFWPKLRMASQKCLILDYDGTLAPFQLDRMKAFPLPGVIDVLKKIRDQPDTVMAIISGRPITEIIYLMKGIGITIIGSHGYEILFPDNRHHIFNPGPEQAARLEQAEQEATLQGWPDRTERKVASVAVHTRGLPDRVAQEVENELLALWAKDSVQYELECRRFNGGLELRAMGMNKGTSLRHLLAKLPQGAFCVYIGDDETDEDAFREIRTSGIGIKVGQSSIPTGATGRLSSCQEVLNFLKEWHYVTSNSGK